ncbi:MAG: hypothetical protein HYU67_06120 [Flavobacteriia bacterium]|nr:hypothetical protein [Flavobacteriia bacterium]
MKFIEIAFRLGVVLGIFSFIWFFIQLSYTLITSKRSKSIYEIYFFKYIQYFLIVNVSFLFCYRNDQFNEIVFSDVIFSGFVLILYLVGKLQNQENRKNLFQFAQNKLPFIQMGYNYYAELGSIFFSISIFFLFIIYPQIATNVISKWFYYNILSIEKSFFFGMIFKLVGFFILMGIIIKLLNGFMFLVSGRPLMSVDSKLYNNKNNKDDDFDSYEEL